MSRITSRRLMLAKNETTYGVDIVPTAAANAIYIGNLSITPHKANYVKRTVLRPYIGGFQSAIASIYQEVSFDVEIAGSGTAGVAPAYGPLMRACSMSETILAAVSTGTATAGSAGSITLAAGASATDGAYNGMAINITGGTGLGQSATISTYTGAAKVALLTGPFGVVTDATSVYTIPAQVVYKPISINQESVSGYFNSDGVQFRLTGARGTVSLGFSLYGLPVYKFKLTGVYNNPSDVPLPAPIYINQAVPLAVNVTNTTGIALQGNACSMSDFMLDVANTVVYQSFPGGLEQIIITDRQSVGSITMEGTLGATKDWWATTRLATTGLFNMVHGVTAGNKVQISGPLVQAMNPVDGNKSGIITLQAALSFSPVNGNDEFAISVQ